VGLSFLLGSLRGKKVAPERGGPGYSNLGQGRVGEPTLDLTPRPIPEGEILTQPSEMSISGFYEEEPSCFQSTVRSVAVAIVAVSFFSMVFFFFVLIYMSAMHMRDGWSHYQDGLKKISGSTDVLIQRFSKVLPKGVVDDLSSKALTGLESALQQALSFILESVTESLTGGLMMLLYMIFWLCQPMHVGKNTTQVFRQYIILKSLASAGYASCVWLLLHVYSIDLAVVFGLISFIFNFVPEVGPFLAMLLPLPIILFDGRLEQPVVTLASVLGGNMLLKCLWGNVIEVKLIESQRDMKLHPVIILFFVAFFGWIWGATGMLLSVPAVAVLKASMHLIPAMYRDPMLVLLEGDQYAPLNYERWRSMVKSESRSQEAASSQGPSQP